MVMKNRFIWVAALLAALVMALPHSAPLFSSLFPQLERPVYTQEPFAWLLWQHILLVGASSFFSVMVGSAIGVCVTRHRVVPLNRWLKVCWL